MSSVARGVGLLAVTAVEGTVGGGEIRWAPPGIDCLSQEPSGTDARGHFSYTGGWQRSGRTGSWPVFLGALLVGMGVLGLVLLRRRGVPRWLRLTAVTTLLFAIAGAGAIVGGWEATLLGAMWWGVPAAFVADRLLRPERGDDRPWTAGLSGAAVAFAAIIIASSGWLYGLGLTAYGLTILLVAALAALPWWRLRPRPVTAR